MSHCVPGRGDKGKSNSTKEILMKGNILRHPLFFSSVHFSMLSSSYVYGEQCISPALR